MIMNSDSCTSSYAYNKANQLVGYLNATTNAGIALSETLAGTGIGALNNLITNMYKAFSQTFDNIEQKLNNARGE